MATVDATPTLSLVATQEEQLLRETVSAICRDFGPEYTRRKTAAGESPTELWSALVKNAMTEDFSWDASAREYATLYKKILRPQAARPSRRSR